MINVAQRLYTFSNQSPLDALRPDAPHFQEKMPFPTPRRTPVKPLISRPILPQDRTASDMTRMAWPTDNQSRTPDGQFGPASQIKGWGDCWFLAALGAVANDNNGVIQGGELKAIRRRVDRWVNQLNLTPIW